jgi:hypothetical protein
MLPWGLFGLTAVQYSLSYEEKRYGSMYAGAPSGLLLAVV